MYKLLVSLLLLLTPLASNAHKQQSMELIPFIGFRSGGDFDQTTQTRSITLEDKASYGFIFAWPYSDNRQGEFLISHYQTQFEESNSNLSVSINNKISVTYLQLGGNIPLSQGHVPFWLSGGLGVTYLSPENSSYSSESQFSMNLGLHTTFALTDQLAVRIGTRLYATFFDTDSQIFCDDQNCIAVVSSDLWLQGEITAGLSFSF